MWGGFVGSGFFGRGVIFIILPHAFLEDFGIFKTNGRCFWSDFPCETTDETARSLPILLNPGKRGFPAVAPFTLVVLSSGDVDWNDLMFWFRACCRELEAFKDWLVNELFTAEGVLFGGVEAVTPLEFLSPILDTRGEVTAAGPFLSDDLDTAGDVFSWPSFSGLPRAFKCALSSSSSIYDGSVGDSKGGSPCKLGFLISGSFGATRGGSGEVRAFLAGGRTRPWSSDLFSFTSEMASIDLACFSYT